MKVKYNKEADVLYIMLTNDKVKESDEDKPGIVIDYAENGTIVGIEILQASKKLPHPMKLEYEIA
jgi:uncharacterized protein YuzE